MEKLSFGERLKIVVACSMIAIPYLMVSVGALIVVFFLYKLFT
jgi:hypothetical protein